MYSRPGDPVIAGLYERVVAILRGGGPIGWTELGQQALAPATEAHPERVHAIGYHDVSPIPWYEAARFEAPGNAGWLVQEPRHGVMLSNASATPQLQAASREQMLAGDWLLCDLLRRALAAPPTDRRA